MAKVVMPLLSGEVHGKVGDIVFFKRYGKQLARMRTIPTNPRTERQMAIRENLAGLSKIWKGEVPVNIKKYNPDTGGFDTLTVRDAVTEDKKMAWENYAVSQGKPKIYGRLLFIGVNLRSLMSGGFLKWTP